MAKAKQKSDLINFTIFHNEFIETEMLSGYEKLVFMSIKRHLNEKTNKSFPSLSTISRYSRLSKSTVQKTLRSLEDKGIIQVERRQDSKNNGNKSNEYTLYDYKSMWTAVSKEEMKQAIEQGQEAEALESLPTENLQRKLKEIQEILERRSKEKGLVSEPVKAHTQALKKNFSKEQNTITESKSQELEQYSIQDIREIYEYDNLVIQYPDKQMDIDIVISVLYDTLNSTKSTIRVGGENKPVEVVLSKLEKLHPDDLIYAIDKYHGQTNRIKNAKGYLLTLLYNSRDQHHLDLSNLGHHNGDF